MRGNITRRFFKLLGVAVCIWITILGAVELFLTSSALKSIVSKFAYEHIDGELSFDQINLSMFTRFPSASISIDNFSVTYPSDRFEEEKKGGQGWLLSQGCGSDKDTLASFTNFSASVRVIPLLAGKIRISELRLSGPRIFAHTYSSDKANWDILKYKPDGQADSSENSIPEIRLGRITLDKQPKIIYTDCRDSLFAMINLKHMVFSGRLDTRPEKKNRINLRIDSLFAAGRAGADTLLFGLDHMGIAENDQIVSFHSSAKAHTATRALGRVTIPIGINGKVCIPEKEGEPFIVNHFIADIASVPINASGQFTLMEDRIAINAGASITKCQITDLLRGVLANLVPDSRKINTNATIDANAQVEGEYIYGSHILPKIDVSLKLPDSYISYSGFPSSVKMGVQVQAKTDINGNINAEIEKINIQTKGAEILCKGNLNDMLGDDPVVGINGRCHLLLDSLVTLLPDTLDISASGSINGSVNGNIKMSQLDVHGIQKADIHAELSAEKIKAKVPRDTVNAFIGSASLSLNPETKISSKTGESFKMLALKGAIDTTDLVWGTFHLKGKDLSLTAMNSTEHVKSTEKREVQRFGGKVKAGKLVAVDKTGLSVGIIESENGFQILPQRNDPTLPLLTFTSSNKAIFLKDKFNRIALSDAVIGADASLRQKDTLARAQRRFPPGMTLPEWLKEEDFRKQDINFRLDETFAKYFRDWRVNGKLSMDKGMLMTPYFPIRNSLQGFEGYFNNNQIRIDSLGIKAGKSNLNAKGSLTGIQRILSGRGRNMLKLDLDVTSERMDATELVRAYLIGSRFDSKHADKRLENASDEEFMQIVTSDTTALDEDASPLIVVPSNLNADIHLNAKDISYSDLAIEELKTNIVMKERCLQITNTSATSNIGNIGLEGFYATRSKKDLQTGFNFNFKDITAEKVISLIPAVDSLMPMLKSFQGRINCELAATAKLDTNMNVRIPSINGIMRITGDDLTIKDNEMFKTLAKKLLFKNKKEGYIEHMSVEGIISDSTVEIFPFILKMDRYTMALSGIQNLDMSFKYHVSLIRSPFVFKLGVDVFGNDFDNWKFKIGKPKYRNAEVPVFTSVIDQTKINLVESINNLFSKGVDAAVKGASLDAVNEYRQQTNYIRAVDQKLEELSEEEQKQFKEESAVEELESREDLKDITGNLLPTTVENINK